MTSHNKRDLVFSQSSEDNFRGVLSSREAYLASGQQQTITVNNMRVPERPEGAKVRFTLTVRTTNTRSYCTFFQSC